jgi:hypothetical protein
MTRAKKRGPASFYLIAIILLSLLVIGATGCESFQGSSSSLFSQAASGKYGVDFILDSGIANIAQGKKVSLGDDFYVRLNAYNYDKEQRSVKICVRDNIDETFGGIKSGGDCQDKMLPAADITLAGTGTKTSEKISPSITPVIFGIYTYHDIPLDMQAKLFVSAAYKESPKITANLQIPTPETETLSIDQSPAVIKTSIIKTVHLKDEFYKADLSITFSKQKPQVNITSPDFTLENKTKLTISMSPFQVECKGLENGFFEIKNEKLISCSALASREENTYPLILQLDYGVKDERAYSFTIQAEQQ